MIHTKSIFNFFGFYLLILASKGIIQLALDGGAAEQTVLVSSAIFKFQYILNIIWISISVVSIIYFLSKKHLIDLFQHDVVWYVIFVYCLSSIFWTELPGKSFSELMLIIASFIFIQIHINIVGSKNMFIFFDRIFLLFSILSLIFILLIPSYGVSTGLHAGKWQGIFTHKNALGNISSLIFVYSLWRFSITKSKVAFITISISFIEILGSGSSTGLLNSLFCILLFISTYFYKINKKVTFLILLFLIFSFFLLFLSINSIVSKDDFRFFDFSDRNLVWIYYLKLIESKWLFGYGINQFANNIIRNENEFRASVGFVVQSTHNGYLQNLYSIGIIGLILTLIILLKFSSIKVPPLYSRFKLLFITNFIILNIFESNFFSFNFFFIILMYFHGLIRVVSFDSDFNNK